MSDRLDNLPVSAIDMIMNALIEDLTQKLYTDIAEDDPTRVNLVRAGRLQEDPQKAGLNLLVDFGDQADASEQHKATDAVQAPVFEIGGGPFLNKEFTLTFTFYYKGEREREFARSVSDVVYSRVQAALWVLPMPVNPKTGLPGDDFGEIPLNINVGAGYLRESGGPGTFIWKGEIRLTVLTELNPL